MRARSAAVLLTAVLAAGCANSGTNGRIVGDNSDQCDPAAKLPESVQRIGLQLPANRADEKFCYRPRQQDEWILQLSFSAARGEVESFLSGNGLPALKEGYSPIISSDARKLGWELDSLSRYSGGEQWNGDGYQSVVVDQSDDARWHVYFKFANM
ncbi:hypothetical protein [Saccharopolyspora taberi]|uniref:Lipoprotein n=1 Tax=Saccharopolyspora taberi TaxID=60895 RepID=A0ABN3VKB2_9PSEU